MDELLPSKQERQTDLAGRRIVLALGLFVPGQPFRGGKAFKVGPPDWHSSSTSLPLTLKCARFDRYGIACILQHGTLPRTLAGAGVFGNRLIQ